MSLPGLGALSNRAPEYQKQNTLVFDELGRLRYAALSRRVLALPLEVLAEIFEHCLPAVEFVSPDPATAPLVLCDVCHHWRVVALTTPMLWSSLSIDMEFLDETHWDAYVYLYQTWLSRAQQAPLTLSIQNLALLRHSQYLHPVLQAIARMSAQWRTIEFDPTEDDTQLLFLNEEATSPHFPLLEKVSYINTESDWQSTLASRLSNAPRLRELCTNSFPLTLPEDFPWAQINTFETRHATLSSCFYVLDRAVNLVQGTFRIWIDDVDAVPTSVATLDHLEALSIDASPHDDEPFFIPTQATPLSVLRHLKTPALKHLILRHDPFEPHPADISPFFSWQSRSAAQLQSLELCRVPASGDTLISCLKVVPSLTQLRLRFLHNVDLNPLFVQFTAISFLPKLETMHCQLNNARLDPHTLAKMLRWRWDAVGVTRLRLFWVVKWNDAEFFEAISVELEGLQSEGMDLRYGNEVVRGG
ncbi:hypothetical protein R3P38DRAFT_539183 [Favolaschia claudopus]|uniref:F-box domain-containing protein n=1 Tax=Favolaschia claudopus TaxID=2862362 RepID=A0AAW0CDQ7_9AGAR